MPHLELEVERKYLEHQIQIMYTSDSWFILNQLLLLLDGPTSKDI